jgi:hypothetical protein
MKNKLNKSELQKSIKNLIQVKNDRVKIDDFARERYNEKFPLKERKFDGGWMRYKDFTIVNEKTLRINYRHGFEDYEYDDCFDVDMTPYYRDEILKEI